VLNTRCSDTHSLDETDSSLDLMLIYGDNPA